MHSEVPTAQMMKDNEEAMMCSLDNPDACISCGS